MSSSVSTISTSESSKNLMAAAAATVAPRGELEEAWFAEEPPASTRRPSSGPPSQPVKIGDFLGDPDVDGWLR